MEVQARLATRPRSKIGALSRFRSYYLLIALIISRASIASCEIRTGKQIAVRRDRAEDTNLISKCCVLGQGLWKTVDLDDVVAYECLDPLSYSPSNQTACETPLVAFDADDLQIGFPYACFGLEYTETNLEWIEHLPSSYCLDKIILDESTINSTTTEGSIVMLTCEKLPKYKLKPNIMKVRKCCKDGHLYDTRYKGCRNSSEGDGISSVDTFKHFVQHESVLLDINYGMSACNAPKYAVDYVEKKYELKFVDSDLVVKNRLSQDVVSLESGAFCVDGTVDGALVARGCRDSCDADVCVVKCCKDGEIYVRSDCKMGPTCQRIEHQSGFEFAPEFSEKRGEDVVVVDPPDVFGVRYGVMCPNGKYKINREATVGQTDFHYLDRKTGHVVIPNFPDNPRREYCVELTDQSACGLDVQMETLICFDTLTVNKRFTYMSIGALISCVCLFLTLVVYLAIPELRNLHGKTLMCHTFAMLTAYSCLAYIQSHTIFITEICISIGYVLYFSFVSAFSWLNIMCFDIWFTFGSARTIQTLRRPEMESRRFVYYSLYAWGLSLLLTGITLAVDFTGFPAPLDPNIGRDSCWFQNNDLSHQILFVLPMGLQILTNCVLFILTAVHVNRVKSEIHRLQAGSSGDRCKRRFMSDKAKYTLNLKLFIVMGITWFWEFVSTLFSKPEELWYVADFINLILGIPIFCILVLKKKVYRLIRKKLGCNKKDSRQSNIPSGSTITTGISSGSTGTGTPSGVYKNGRHCSTSSYGSDRNSSTAMLRHPATKTLTVMQEDDVITLRTS